MKNGHTRLGGEDRRVRCDASLHQRALDRSGEALQLDQFALLKLGVGLDDLGADPGESVALREHLRDRIESGHHDREWTRVRWCSGEPFDPQALELLAAAE